VYWAQPVPGRVREDDVKRCINRAGSRVSLNVVEPLGQVTHVTRETGKPDPWG